MTPFFVATLFALPLVFARTLSLTTIVPILEYKIIFPLHLLSENKIFSDRAIAALFLASILPTSALCGLFFGYILNRRTILFSALTSCVTVSYFICFDQSQEIKWIPLQVGFLICIFICCCGIGKKIFQKTAAYRAKGDTIRTTSFASAIILVTICFAFWLYYYYSPLGMRISGDGFEGIIFSKTTAQFLSPEGATYWDISQDDVRRLENGLKTYVKNNNRDLGSRLPKELGSYRRWYISGSSEAGEKVIRVELMYKPHVSRSDWLHEFFGVMGGGDYYWHMTYVVKNGRFQNVHCNADA
jgi:hypothetical protein